MRVTNQMNRTLTLDNGKETLLVGEALEGNLNGATRAVLTLDLTLVGVAVEVRLYQQATPNAPFGPIAPNPVYVTARANEVTPLEFDGLRGYAVRVSGRQASGNSVDVPCYWTLEAD